MKSTRKYVLTIVETAMLIALLIVFQVTTSSLGQFVTGSLVNLVLIISALSVGLVGGLAVAAVSPVVAFLLGVGPAFPQIVPFIVAANAVIVLSVYLISGRDATPVRSALSIIVGAALKFFVLWAGVVKVILPFIPGLKEKQISVISASFSWPQLVTALIGGALALAVWYSLRAAVPALKNRRA